MTLIEVLQGIEGAATARRVGTDGLTPTFAKLLPMAFPGCRARRRRTAMRTARRIKTPDEVDAIRAAVRVAEHGARRRRGRADAGRHRAALTGVFMEAMAAGGVTHPGDPGRRLDHLARTPVAARRRRRRRARRATWSSFDAGVLAGGYVGEVGRTWPVGDVDAAPVGALYRAMGRAVGPAARRLPARSAGQRPARRLRRGRRTAAADAGGPRPGPRLRPAGGHAATCPRPPPRRPSKPAWCWRSPATSGRRVSARSTPATPVLITADGPEVLSGQSVPESREQERQRDRRPTDPGVPKQIILYEKDPKTKIATITLNRPERLNAPTIGGPAPLRRPAPPRQHRRRRQGAGDPRRRRRLRQRRRPPRVHGGAELRRRRPAAARSSASRTTTSRTRPKGSLRHGATVSPVVRRPARRLPHACRSSRRSASSRSRATATAGTSTRPPTPTS